MRGAAAPIAWWKGCGRHKYFSSNSGLRAVEFGGSSVTTRTTLSGRALWDARPGALRWTLALTTPAIS